MRIKPDDNRRWYYDEEHDQMMLSLANGMSFRSRLTCRTLTPDVLSPTGLCVDDVALYFSFEEKCHDFNLSKKQKAELVLNILIAIHYLKPQMPRSRHSVSHSRMWVSTLGDATRVRLSDTRGQVNLLVVELGEDAALCPLARLYAVIMGRVIQLDGAIKIMNDRLKPQANVDSLSLEQAV